MSSNNSVGSKGTVGTMCTTKSKSETVNYLLLYEAMVRHQDLEFDATHDHMALTVARVQYLGRKSNAANAGGAAPELVNENAGGEPPRGMLTYLQMRRCLLRLGYTWNRSIAIPQSNANSIDDFCYDDDVSVMSTNSGFSGGGGSTSSAQSSMTSTRDIIATDAQLIMLLTTLVEMEERHRALKLARRDDTDSSDEEEEEKGETPEEKLYSQGLFLPEFIQAYKLIIGGMQSLQTYPSPEMASEGALAREALQHGCAALGIHPQDLNSLQDIRVRSRERTLGLLRLFGPDSKFIKDEVLQSAGEDPSTGKKKSKDGLNHTKNRSPKRINAAVNLKSKGRGNKTAKDGLLPRLSEEEIRALVHSKDKALANILEEHASEMNVMAVNMEELRLKGVQSQKNTRKRRKRQRIAAVFVMISLACGGAFYEFHKREQVKVEIATGREAERMADATTISKLEKSLKGIKEKLNDAEATIRYEEGRKNELQKNYDKASKSLGEVEAQWLLDQRELERCRVTRKELDADLTALKTHNEASEEEVGWCRERLNGAERAMEGMEEALKKNRAEAQKQAGSGGSEGVNLKVPSFADIAKEADKGLARTSKDKKKGDGKETGEVDGKTKGKKIKPVKMEMKYNKSFRNAVILRQVYSAVAGMVVSAFVPGIFKLFGLLF